MFGFTKPRGRTAQRTTDSVGPITTPRDLRKISHKLGKLRWRFYRLSQKASRQGVASISLQGVDGAILQLQTADATARDALKQALRRKGGAA